jgi:hypothetical protein
MNHEQIQTCIAACADCARECTQFCEDHRADSGMLICVINCRDCADLCELCIRALETNSRVAGALCIACAAACDLCIAAFQMHKIELSRRCAEACGRCRVECRTQMAEIASAGGDTLLEREHVRNSLHQFNRQP